MKMKMANDNMNSGSDLSAAPPKAVPYELSLTLIATAAFVSPLLAAIWSIHRAGDSHGDLAAPHHRQLNIECNWTAVTASGGEVEEGLLTSAVASTSIVSGVVALLCLIGYELFRRDPIVGKYVYDRKRLAQPDRTPPPLMLSRSLWDSGEGDENSTCCKLTCFRVRPALLELVFLNLDENYIRYSRAAYEARVERERRGHYACCRRGRYHDNCCNRRRLTNTFSSAGDGEHGEFVDEDGYVFYSGYCRDYSHVHQTNNSRLCSAQKMPILTSIMADQEPDQEPDEEVQSPKWEKSIGDLFPEDNPTKYFTAALAAVRLLPGDARRNSSRGASGNDDSLPNVARNPVIGEVETHLIPKGDSQDSGSMRFNDAEDFLEKEPATLRSSLLENSDEEDVDSDLKKRPLKYPYRLKYLFMPPGFHTWASVLEYLGYFFLCRKTVSWTPAAPRSRDNDHFLRGSSLAFTNPGKDLNEGEEELLRCAGLDTYLLVRLARFGFDVTFYPFIFAFVAVLPIYHACRDQATPVGDGFLSLTVNRIPQGSGKMIWIVIFTMLLYLYILRRLWIEWEAFIKLRHSFLADGDTSIHSNPTYLKKYRNTCIVESVPKSHQSDRDLKDFFESLYSGQIEHAEMVIDTSRLEEMVKKRQTLIAKYDDIDAQYRYDCWMYEQSKGKAVGFCGHKVPEPVEPMVRDGLCGEKMNALRYYDDKIEEVDALADKEYRNIFEARMKWRNASLAKSEQGEDDSGGIRISLKKNVLLSAQDMYTFLIPSYVRKKFFGEQSDLCYGTGMLTFKSITAKQSAVQCNLSGRPNWMLVNEGPDPRDILWSNIGVDCKLLENRKVIVQFVLLIGILVWGTIVTFIHEFTVKTIDGIPSFSGGLIQGYLPAYVVSLILLWIPNLFFLLARHVICFKSFTRCDEFVLLWNTGFRLANILFTFFAMSLLQALQCLRENPDDFLKVLSEGIMRQGAFLTNLMIVATGQETMLQLLQWRSLIKQAIIRPLINLNARSKRYLDWLNAAPEFEESFIFGFFAPVLSYGLMIAIVFAFLAPFMLGVCALFFWTAAKVHMHNALFVYRQRFEGGGKIFYYWNRIVFITLYSSILIFAGILILRRHAEWSIAFILIMTLITYCVDKSVEKTFVTHSLHLPITIAKIHDEKEEALLSESNIKPDGGENFMYRNPILNQDNWN